MKQIYISVILISIYGSGISCSLYKEYYINKYCSNGNRYKTIELDNDEDDSAIILKSGSNYKNYMDCNVYVEAEKDYGIIVNVRKVNLRKIVDNLEIEINKSIKPEWNGNKDNNNKESLIYWADRKIKVHFSSGYSSESTKSKEFELILTTFRKSNKCSQSEIDCGKGRCIPLYYQCDGYNNCGNYLDEIGCNEAKQMSNFAIVGSLMGALVGVLLLCYCCRCCCGKSKKREEYIDFQEDEIDSFKTQPHISSVEPSAPFNQNMNYGSMRSYEVRYPVNPNYPYFIDGSNPPQSSGVNHQYSHFPPPPPPYSPPNDTEKDDQNQSNLKRGKTS